MPRADGREVLLGDREPFGVDVADRQLGTRSRQLDGQRLPDTAPPPVTAGTGLGSWRDANFPGEPCMNAPRVAIRLVSRRQV